jgi:hypothetical protein
MSELFANFKIGFFFYQGVSSQLNDNCIVVEHVDDKMLQSGGLLVNLC